MNSATARNLPTREQLRIWRDYTETAESLRSLLGSRMQSESAVSTADYQVMLALSEATGRRLRSSALASSIGWQRSRLSHHLGRMEARGLIVREGSAADNRGSEVLLTAAGAEVFRRCSVPHLRDVRELFVAALTPEQLAALDGVSAALRVHLGLPGR